MADHMTGRWFSVVGCGCLVAVAGRLVSDNEKAREQAESLVLHPTFSVFGTA